MQQQKFPSFDPYQNDPEVSRLRCLQADVEYFICIYGEKEALELTNIDNPTSNVINAKRIALALEDAFVFIANNYSAASAASKVLIQSSLRRSQAIIARKYLDTLHPRKLVTEEFERVIEQLATWSSQSSAQTLNKFSEAYKYYRDQPYSQGVSLVSSAHERKRIFTAASLEPFVWNSGSNDVTNVVKYEDSLYTVNYQIGDPTMGQVSPTGTELPPAVQGINQLYDGLDRTLSVGSFEETASESDRTPDDYTILNINPNTDNPATPNVNEDIIDPETPYNLTF